MNAFPGIAQSARWVEAKPIQYGWSGDEKYHIIAPEGEYLLRLSPAEQYERRAGEYASLSALQGLGLPIPQGHAFGRLEDGRAYTLLSWLPGEDAETALPRLDSALQYRLGVDAGRALKTMHTLPAPQDLAPWDTRFNAKIDRVLADYTACPVKLPNETRSLAIIEEYRPLLHGRPQCFQHGDFHTGNFLIGEKWKLCIIDFDRSGYGDPFEEFNRIAFSAKISEAFACGQIDGYFEGAPPLLFFRLLALYLALTQLGNLPWATRYGDDEIAVMLAQGQEIDAWYEGFETMIPSWYKRKGAIIP